MMEIHVGGADRMVLSQWRHDKLSGGVTLDVGIHNADMMLFYLGQPVEVYGQTRLYEPIRRRSSEPAWRGGFHRRTLDGAPESFPATAEDALFAQIRFADGALCQWTAHYAGHGESFGRRVIYGRKGSLRTPGERTGKPLSLVVDGVGEVAGEAVLEHAPSYKLDPLSTEFFGDARPWMYEMPFVEVDRKLIALEQYELAEAARGRLLPEVDAEAGRSAAAIVYGACESGLVGRAVSVEEIEGVAIDAYQREIDAHLGLVPSP